jgi:hypothetical protein
VNEAKSIVERNEHDHESGVEPVMTHEHKLQIARILYRMIVGKYPGRFVMLRDQDRLLARSDHPEMMPPLS